VQQQVESDSAGMIGPQMGPSAASGSGAAFPPLEDPTQDEDPSSSGGGGGGATTATAPPVAPGSPYSSTRATLRDLTLPPVPNMDIPPSPPGSPPPATNKKFAQFLELKKKGVHFNSKIAGSSALKNPALMDKLLGFVDLDQKDQYATTLAPDIWNPKGFPRHAFREQLRASQSEMTQARARGKGAAVEFVPATAAAVEEGSVSSGGSKRKTRFDT
jgi:hypothetical protein